MSADHDHDHGGHGHAGHSHGVSAEADRGKLAIALGLLLGFMAFEVVVGIVVHSLALLSDAAHMLTDAGAIALSLVAIRLAAKPAKGAMTYGFKRAEILSAQFNGATLLGLNPNQPRLRRDPEMALRQIASESRRLALPYGPAAIAADIARAGPPPPDAPPEPIPLPDDYNAIPF
jgi:hypothetical protein